MDHNNSRHINKYEKEEDGDGDHLSLSLGLPGLSTAAATTPTPQLPPLYHLLQQQQQQQQTYSFFTAAADQDAKISSPDPYLLLPPPPPPLHHHPPQQQQPYFLSDQDENIAPPSPTNSSSTGHPVSKPVGTSRPRCNADPEPIDPPYPWSTDRKAIIHTLDHLDNKGITVIRGNLKCKRCEATKEMDYDLHKEFLKVGCYIYENKGGMAGRAPAEWMYPTLQDCEECSQPNSLMPVIPADEESINWLFMLLGQTLGLLSLKQLKWFCQMTNHHSTGAKNRVLYYTYLTLCKQLDPYGPFDVEG